MQKPQGGGKFLVQIPRGVCGGMVMDEIDTYIIQEGSVKFSIQMQNETNLWSIFLGKTKYW